MQVPVELLLKKPDDYLQSTVPNKFGITFKQVFYLNINDSKERQKASQNKLIKEFYALLNNKKMFDQENIKAGYQNKNEDHLSKVETRKPELAPGTKRMMSAQKRDGMSRDNYSTVLS